MVVEVRQLGSHESNRKINGVQAKAASFLQLAEWKLEMLLMAAAVLLHVAVAGGVFEVKVSLMVVEVEVSLMLATTKLAAAVLVMGLAIV